MFNSIIRFEHRRRRIKLIITLSQLKAGSTSAPQGCQLTFPFYTSSKAQQSVHRTTFSNTHMMLTLLQICFSVFLLLTDHSRFLCGPSIVRVQPYEYLGVYTDSSLEFSSLLGLLSCTAETTCSYADCTCAHINCYFWQKILYFIFGKFLR